MAPAIPLTPAASICYQASMKFTYGLPLVLMLACSCHERTDQLEQRLAESEARVAALETKLEAQSRATDERVQEALTRLDVRWVKQADLLRGEIYRNDQNISAELEKLARDIRLCRKDISTMRQEKSAPPRAAEILSSAPAVVTDPFPFTVTEISGQEVITGTHKSTRLEDTEETYKDRYGKLMPIQKPVEKEINEYGYEVTCVLSNHTATARDASIRAGLVTRLFTIPAHSTTNLALPAAMGAALHISSGGHSKSFPIHYTPQPQ